MSNRKEKKEGRLTGKSRKTYSKPILLSQMYQERGALGCGKMNGASPRCNANPDVS